MYVNVGNCSKFTPPLQKKWTEYQIFIQFALIVANGTLGILKCVFYGHFFLIVRERLYKQVDLLFKTPPPLPGGEWRLIQGRREGRGGLKWTGSNYTSRQQLHLHHLN